MKMRVLKYPLATTQKFKVAMPAGSKILAVALQNGEPHIWVEAPEHTFTSEARDERYFSAATTGSYAPGGYAVYIGSVVLLNQDVLHYYEDAKTRYAFTQVTGVVRNG